MDQRSMAFNMQCIGTEMEIDSPSYVPQESHFFSGTSISVHHSNVPFANASSSVDLLHHAIDYHDSPVPYGMNHYSTFHPQPENFDAGSSSAPRMLPPPMNFGSTSQMSLHGNYWAHGGTYQEYGMNHFVDGVGCPYKRKTIENPPENNHHYSSASASTSTSFMGPVDTRHSGDVVRLRDSSTSYGPPLYGESSNSITLDESSSSNVRVRSGVSGLTSSEHTHNYGNPSNLGSYNSSGQSFLRGGPFWFDQASSSNSIDRGALAWSHPPPPPPPAMPFMNTFNVNGVPMEIGNQGIQGPLEVNMNRSSTNFFHFPYFSPQHCHLPYLSPPVHGTRSRNGNLEFQLQAPTPPHSVSHVGPSEPTGFRTCWPHSTAVIPETMSPRHHGAPHFRVSAVDEVAVIDYDEAYGVGNYDNHMDMRLDIEDMSYEELLALGELIGNVNTGLPEETISSQLKTRTWTASLLIDLEELPCDDQEAASCIICQDVYEDHEKLGSLECGHEFHASCLKKWLLVKNVCPICKSKALPGDK
ncbi:hypothetical protein SAY86_003444 [Trapa natans]|uniref:RING-type E3 ubiquitin transferase n=1 Tax=Trapa natans TaxID=22666 RepID=A0AAN7RGX3_TRANT|nr:hypothetical protein SAY86_003444 [Trapa natans]